jgi:hypothetical protein
MKVRLHERGLMWGRAAKVQQPRQTTTTKLVQAMSKRGRGRWWEQKGSSGAA